MLSNQDMDRIDQLHDEVDDILEGEDMKISLNALCAAMAGQCAQAVLTGKVTKQRFLAEIVECIDEWHAHYEAILKDKQ